MGNVCEYCRRRVQRALGGAAVYDWQGGLTVAGRAGYRNRAGKSERVACFEDEGKKQVGAK